MPIVGITLRMGHLVQHKYMGRHEAAPNLFLRTPRMGRRDLGPDAKIKPESTR